MMKKIIVSLMVAYVALVVAFVVLMTGVYCLPSSLIVDHVIESAQLLQREGQGAQLVNGRLGRLDNYTDALMLNLAVSGDAAEPLRSAMLNPYYDVDEEGVAKSIHTEHAARGETAGLEKMYYGRYWLGFLVTLKPMLCFMGLRGIRIVNILLLSLLCLCTLIMIGRKIGWVEAVLLVVCLGLMYFPVVPFTMQYSTCFYLMFMSMLAVMLWPSLTRDSGRLVVTFFVIGAVTSFVDFLTTPQLTLGMPLVVGLLAHRRKETWQWVVMACVAWGLGYGLLWASKWVIGYWLTGYNLLSDAAEQIGVRTSQNYYGIELSVPTMVQFVLFGEERALGWKIPVVVAVVTLAYLYLQKGAVVQKRYFWLAMIALIVPVWFLSLRQHSVMHLWFTTRAFLVTLYAGMLWMYYTVKTHKE